MTPKMKSFENVFPDSMTGHQATFRHQIWWNSVVAKLLKGFMDYRTQKTRAPRDSSQPPFCPKWADRAQNSLNVVTPWHVHIYQIWRPPCWKLLYRRILANKKLSCRRKTARRFVSLNISLSHSRSLKLIRNDTLQYRACKSLLVFRWNYVYLVPFLRYSASSNGVTLKSGIGGHSKSLKMAAFDRSYTSL